MAEFNISDINNYSGQGQGGGGGFFSLKNDKDIAIVRFMYNTIDDITGYAVHESEVEGKKRYINCLREYNQPVNDCPLCAARYRVIAKMFIMIFDMETEEVKIWDRGKTFYSKIVSLTTRYNPLVATPFEIERNGKRGDMKTTYETYPLTTDEISLEDLPETPELLGTLILDKSYEELESFLANGYFEESNTIQAPPQRNPENDNREKTPNEMPVRRRPTASNNRIESSANIPPASRRYSSDKF